MANEFLTKEGATALRDFAAAMPIAVKNIVDDTEALFVVYKSVEEKLGVHGNDFAEMLKIVKKAQLLADEAILELPAKLQKTATKIDAYVAKKRSINS